MTDFSPIALGFLGSLAAGSLTVVGAIPVLFGRVPSRATRDLSLGFAAGVMLSAEGGPVDLVLWPETAFPGYLDEDAQARARIAAALAASSDPWRRRC